MIETEGKDAHPYSPALIPVGDTKAGPLLVDLEAISTISLAGDHNTITGWLNSLATTRQPTKGQSRSRDGPKQQSHGFDIHARRAIRNRQHEVAQLRARSFVRDGLPAADAESPRVGDRATNGR